MLWSTKSPHRALSLRTGLCGDVFLKWLEPYLLSRTHPFPNSVTMATLTANAISDMNMGNNSFQPLLQVRW